MREDQRSARPARPETGGTTASAAPGHALGWLSRRFFDRDDSEHEQALVRIGMIAFMFAYMMLYPHPPERIADILLFTQVFFAVAMTSALGIVAAILWRPQISPVRRGLGVVLDITGANVTMLLGGHAATIFYPVLLWAIFGHGFRFGNRYLFAASGLAVVQFGLVTLISPDWRRFPALDFALVLALIILPAYVSLLLAKLNHALERAEDASRAKSQFLATMSHEFRTPLNAVIGMSDLLRTTPLTPDQKDMAATIRTAARSLLALINDVLDIAKIEARHLVVEQEPFRLEDRLAILRGMLFHQARGKGLYLRLRIDPDVPSALVGGVRPLHQVLVNLVANAIKFTDRGGVLIDVRLVERHEDRVRLRFEVHDSGIGIAYVDQPHVFERFTQSGGEPARRRGGTGLGLSIARELVELMAGSIGLVSSPGGGSSFWFELPLALDEPRARRSHLPRDARLLVIGDERGLEPLLQHFAGGPPRVERIADMAALPAILRESDVPTALLVAGGGPQADAASLADRITEMRLNEPVDVLTFARHPIAMPTHTLADLSPIGATREILERCLAHAFARAGSEDEEGDAELVAEHADDHGAPRLDAKRSARLLLAEDNKTNQRVLARILEQAGHEVAVVADGRQALDRLERDRFDVVLLDVNMPVMGGFDAIKMLRFTHDLSELPPIVALTADATRETRDAALELGFSAYLTKPVDSRQMLAAIDRLTAASAPTHEAHPTAPAMVSPARPPPAEWSGPVRPRAQVIPLAPRVAAETPSPLDEARVASLVALDAGDGFFAKVVEDYLADAASLIAALQMDAAAGKAGAFRDSAHALKSSSAHVGATALFERCLGWRNLDDHALMLRARAELADLQRDFDSVRRALLERREQAADGRITSTTRPGRRQDGSH